MDRPAAAVDDEAMRARAQLGLAVGQYAAVAAVRVAKRDVRASLASLEDLLESP